MELAFKLPSLKKVLRGVRLGCSFSIQRLSTDENVVSLLLLIPDDLRVALVLREIVSRSEQRFLALDGLSVIPQPGCAGIGRARPVLIPVIARIEEIKVLAVGNG